MISVFGQNNEIKLSVNGYHWEIRTANNGDPKAVSFAILPHYDEEILEKCFLRHQGFVMWCHPNASDDLYKADTSFWVH